MPKEIDLNVAKSRNDQRTAFFSSKNKKQKSVTIFLFDGDVEMELRQPTIGDISKMRAAAEGKFEDTIISILIAYCYVPGTDEKFFDPADRDQILSMPTGEWLTTVNKAIADLTGVNVEEEEKN